MHSQLSHIVAQEHIADLYRAAADRRLVDQPRSHRQPARQRPLGRLAALLKPELLTRRAVARRS